MTKEKISHPNRITVHEQKLSTTEKSIINSIRLPLFRSIVKTIWQFKLYFQFTGWLQYILPASITLVVFLVGALMYVLRYEQVANLFVFVGLILLAVQTFDLVTVKFQLHFPEPLPERKDDLGLFDLMRSRRSCRSFQTRKLTSVNRTELLEYVRLRSEEPKISKSAVRFEYISASLTVWPTVNATEFLVAIAPKKYDRMAVIDVGRSLQKIVIDATRMGLGSCWIGPGADQTSVIQHLGDRYNEDKDHIICICAIGYRSRYVPLFIRIFNARLFRRLPLSSLFFTDPQLKDAANVNAPPYNRYGRTYEICQWAPSSYNGQTTRCAAVTEAGKEGKLKVERFDFYTTTESKYYAAVATGIWCANWEMGCDVLGIHGRFVYLSTVERGIQDEKELSVLPRYELSWVLDESA